MLARHLHEAAHVRARLPAEQRLAAGRRAVMDEVVERGVVGQERHRLMDEAQNGDADRLGHPASSGYFAAAGNAGSLPMSRMSCWMMTVAFRLATIPFMRSIEATVAARSKLKCGTPPVS